MNRSAVVFTAVLTLVACERICVETHRAVLDGYEVLIYQRSLELDPAAWVEQIEESQYRLEECRKSCRRREG